MSISSVKQIISVKINLEPNEVNSKYEDIIKNKLKNKYGDKCYINGYIYKSSIEIVKISGGRCLGSHLHGAYTFEVAFSALFSIPVKGDKIQCKINTINTFGIVASAYPINKVFIPRTIQLSKNPDVLEKLSVNSFVLVEIMDSAIVDNKLCVGGYIIETNISPPNIFIVPNASTNISIEIIKSKEISKPLMINNSVLLGNNEEVITAEHRIKDEKIWAKHIRKLINPYEMLNDHGNLVNIESSVVSRAFFKLWEILNDVDGPNENNSIKIACLAEAPGGFISSLWNYRNRIINQSNDEFWTISLRKSDITGPMVRDFDDDASKYFFDYINKQGGKINVDDKTSGDLTDTSVIKSFISDVGKSSCSYITADGGIDKSTNELYDLEEVANAKLFYGEIITAIGLQKEGGTFVIKFYDIYYEITVQLILLLQKYYEKVSITKPKTSRPANSEKYIVAEKFIGISDSEYEEYLSLLDTWNSIETEQLPNYKENKNFIERIFNISIDPDSEFIYSLKSFNEKTSREQLRKLIDGIGIYDTYENDLKGILMSKTLKTANNFDKFTKEIKYNQNDLAVEWCKTYNVPIKKII
jgi:DNA-directed RNA polymerase subunit E'/Rpb7